LNLDEVRHLCDFLDFPEKLANALATGKRLRHLISRFVEPSGRDDSPEGRNPSRPSGQASKPFYVIAIRLPAEAPSLCRRAAEIWKSPGFSYPGIIPTDFTLT
jgi:hypothetical protein